jgi:hypothetical protein
MNNFEMISGTLKAKYSPQTDADYDKFSKN